MRTITHRTTVYTLDELTAEARAAAIANVSEKLTGDWWDTHDIERVTETIVYALADALKTPGREKWGVGDFPGIEGVKLSGWDIERGQSVLFDGKLTRENAPALPWVNGIEAVELDAKRDHTYITVEESEPECTCPPNGSWLSPHEAACPTNAPNPATTDQHKGLREAARDAIHKAWEAGRQEGDYIGSAQYATEDIEANERLFHADGALYAGPQESTPADPPPAGDTLTVTVTFTTSTLNTALPAKVVAGVEALCNEAGLDHHPTSGGGPFHDLFVTVTGADGAPIWGSEFDGAANNEDTDDEDGS